MVIPEGEEVVLNCTTTLPSIVMFGIGRGPSRLMETSQPVGSVWTFPAVVENSGLYFCNARYLQVPAQHGRNAIVVVYPTADT